jgi:hypothetical protein
VAALLVGFDAAVRFGAARTLSDSAAPPERDVRLPTLAALVGEAPSAAPAVLGAYRAALAAVAGGAAAIDTRRALAWTRGAAPDTPSLRAA